VWCEDQNDRYCTIIKIWEWWVYSYKNCNILNTDADWKLLFIKRKYDDKKRFFEFAITVGRPKSAKIKWFQWLIAFVILELCKFMPIKRGTLLYIIDYFKFLIIILQLLLITIWNPNVKIIWNVISLWWNKVVIGLFSRIVLIDYWFLHCLIILFWMLKSFVYYDCLIESINELIAIVTASFVT
jgi:hypothetical protein